MVVFLISASILTLVAVTFISGFGSTQAAALSIPVTSQNVYFVVQMLSQL
jgi:hypothetical protein